MAISKLLYIS